MGLNFLIMVLVLVVLVAIGLFFLIRSARWKKNPNNHFRPEMKKKEEKKKAVTQVTVTCPHCKNTGSFPVTEKMRECEWCGNKI